MATGITATAGNGGNASGGAGGNATSSGAGNSSANGGNGGSANGGSVNGGVGNTTTTTTSTQTTNPAVGPHVDITMAPANGPEINTMLQQSSGATPMTLQQTSALGGTLTGVTSGNNELASFGPAGFLKGGSSGHTTFLPESHVNTVEIHGASSQTVIIPGTTTDVVNFDHNLGDVFHLAGGLTPPTAANEVQGTVTDANEHFVNHSALVLSLGDNTTVALENVTATAADVSSWFV